MAMAPTLFYPFLKVIFLISSSQRVSPFGMRVKSPNGYILHQNRSIPLILNSMQYYPCLFLPTLFIDTLLPLTFITSLQPEYFNFNFGTMKLTSTFIQVLCFFFQSFHQYSPIIVSQMFPYQFSNCYSFMWRSVFYHPDSSIQSVNLEKGVDIQKGDQNFITMGLGEGLISQMVSEWVYPGNRLALISYLLKERDGERGQVYFLCSR